MASDPDPHSHFDRPLPYQAGAPGAGNGNSAGTAALVIGIIALVCSFIPVIGLLSWLLAPAAIVTGAIGMGKEPRGSAIAGLVTGGIALVICILWVVALGAMMASIGNARNF